MAVFNLPVLILSDRTAPVISGTSVGNPLSIDENIAASSLVATMTDDGTAVSYAIVSGNTNGDFAIANNGDITVVNSPDYETTSSYSLGITATDNLGNTSAPFTVTININDVDEIPPVVTLVSQPYVAVYETENSLTIASFTASDAGADVTSSLVLSGTPNTTNFSLSYNTSTQQMDLVTSASGLLGGGVTADQTFSFTISATDALGNTGSTTCNLLVKSEPAFTGPTSVNVTENTTTTSTNIASYTLQRPTPVTWSLSGTDASDFTITSTGIVRFAANPDYELPSDSNQDRQYSLSVNASNVYGVASSNLIVNLQNDPSDDPLVYDLNTSHEPTYGFGVYQGDFFWITDVTYSGQKYLIPVWYDVSANNLTVGTYTSGVSDRRACQDDTSDFWVIVGNGRMLCRYLYGTSNNNRMLSWDISSSSGFSNRQTANTSSSTSYLNQIYYSDHGGFMDGLDVHARENRRWAKWVYNSTSPMSFDPWTEVTVSSGHWPNQAKTFQAKVGNYIYAVAPSNFSGSSYSTGSKNQVMVYSASNYSYYGSTSIQYWPGNSGSTNRGIAYDGSNIWICRGDEIAKFTTPPSNNPTAQLVPTQ